MMASSSSVNKESTAARFSEVGSARKSVADSVALVMASSGEAIASRERKEARPRKRMWRGLLSQRPRRNEGKDGRLLVGLDEAREKRAGNYSWSLGVCVARNGKTTEVLPTMGFEGAPKLAIRTS